MEPSTFISINIDQIFLEAINLMSKHRVVEITVYDLNGPVANITSSEITNFLSHESKSNLLYHKLNYSVSSFLSLRTSK